ncbi:hypothetical protein J6590_019112 [Homalodisca vitripennis]|nr:hypothetical protein J6590_019112 [Homalodisca vitripennis]
MLSYYMKPSGTRENSIWEPHLAKLQETSIWETHWNNTPAPADELQYATAWRNCRRLRFGKLTGTTHQLQRMSRIAVRYGLAKLQETSIWETHWNNTPAPADELQYAMAWRNCRRLRFGKLTGTTHQLQRMSCSTLWLGEAAGNVNRDSKFPIGYSSLLWK